ncbi:kynureninase-like [Anneissia japonica]|uniref:kynureninase-like n=1 Tax=Anneissia japonica TaxID=1529436 RepID=UPI0014258151|nr:kynureninase-like [Anneissia japonica]XP_033120272.1 kynureninase-like [Anneissia japonica]XP_033120281.1 kynureninase-like [Anneissia japonica]
MTDDYRPSKRFCRAKSEDPATRLQGMASQFGCKITDEDFALKMDVQDPLAYLKKEFEIPKMKDLPGVDLSLVDAEAEGIYMSGNSLGLMPRLTRQYMTNELDKWSKTGVYGHFSGELPWVHCDERVQADMAKLAGAEASEVCVMNALTVNLHLLMMSFYQPTKTRNKILMESKAFPSDQYMIESQIQLHGYKPSDCIIYANPRQGEHVIRTEDILELINKHGSEIATIMFSGVQYFTGQLFDMETITKAGHDQGCLVGFDLAHAIGNVELRLHDWNVDFAAWCNYKYVNSGAGCLAAAFIHNKHSCNVKPKLLGWWGHRYVSRFKMDNTMDLSPGVAGYRISNPSIMAIVPLKASLEVFNKTSMSEIVSKQVLLTGYLEYLVNHYFAKDAVKPGMPYIDIITPSNSKERGCQLSFIFSIAVDQVHKQLKKRGVTCDKREPDVLRFAPIPFYTSYISIYHLIGHLQQALKVCVLNTTSVDGVNGH